jgi:sulfur-oxidizing protein SoxB
MADSHPAFDNYQSPSGAREHMINRRDFLAAAAALSAEFSCPDLASAARKQALTQNDLLAHKAAGKLTLLHVTDIHAQTKPIYYREPSVNLGAGEAKGRPPHLTQADFLRYFNITQGSAGAYALTSTDYEALARNYGKLGGLDRVATILKAVRAERGESNVLFLDGGDTWQGSWVALKTQAQDMIELMSLLKTDAMSGHWEFTYGNERVKAAIDGLPFAFLAQNIRDTEWGEAAFTPKKVFERAGAKIAVIGQAFPFTPIANPRYMMPGWEFGIREEDMQKQVDEARASGVDVVVVLSHNGFDVDHKMASRVKGIDVFLTGHTHDAAPVAIKAGSTLLIASGSHGKFVSRLDLDIKDKKVVDFSYKLIPVFSDVITPDAEMAAAIAKTRGPFERELGKALAHTETLLYRRGNFNGSMDDLICDAMLAERDCEIAMSPGFRWGSTLLADSTITFEDVTNATAVTYPNCYRTAMTGARLKEIIEDVADNIFNADPYYQQGGDMVRIGGLGYTIDINQSIGNRISNMTLLKSGAAIEPAKSYVVSGWASVNQSTEGPPIWEVVKSYLIRVKTVHVKENTAIKVVGA